MPSGRDRALQGRIRRHCRGGLRVEAAIRCSIARHRRHKLRHLSIERQAAGMNGLNLIACVAAEPAGNVDLVRRAEQVDDQIIAALLEPQVLIRDAGGGGEVDRAVGRAGVAVIDRVLAEAGTELVGCGSGTAIKGLIIAGSGHQRIVAGAADQDLPVLIVADQRDVGAGLARVQIHQVVEGLAGEVVSAGGARFDVKRAAIGVDRAELAQLIGRQHERANTCLQYLHAGDVHLRDVVGAVVRLQPRP